MFKKVSIGLLVLALLGGATFYLVWQEDEDAAEEIEEVVLLEEMESSEVTVEETEEVVEEESIEEAVVVDYENWDHIANSLTKYLIWWGDEVAMVENCPGGYYEAYGEGSGVYFCEDTENRWLQFEWLDGTEIPVSSEAGDWFLWDRTNPGGSSFQETMTSDEKYWLYLDNWTSDEDRFMAYDVANATEEVLMSFYAIEYASSCEGIRFVGWNPSGTRFGIIVRNDAADDTYPENTKLFILTIEDGKLVTKNKYNIPIFTDCSPNNAPFFAAEWTDDDTIMYYDPNDGDHFELLDIYYGDERWTSGYTRYYDVE